MIFLYFCWFKYKYWEVEKLRTVISSFVKRASHPTEVGLKSLYDQRARKGILSPDDDSLIFKIILAYIDICAV